YFQVATGDQLGGLRGYPRYMTEQGYRQYLREAGKTELRRVRVDIPNPQGAYLYLEQLMSERWIWAVLPNNCVPFCDDAIAALRPHGPRRGAGPHPLGTDPGVPPPARRRNLQPVRRAPLTAPRSAGGAAGGGPGRCGDSLARRPRRSCVPWSWRASPPPATSG